MTYYQSETITVWARIRDSDKVLVDPTTSITISIDDPEGTAKVTDAAMTNDSTGVYYYDYAIPADAVLGVWTTEVTASSGKPSIEQDEFMVEEKL